MHILSHFSALVKLFGVRTAEFCSGFQLPWAQIGILISGIPVHERKDRSYSFLKSVSEEIDILGIHTGHFVDYFPIVIVSVMVVTGLL